MRVGALLAVLLGGGVLSLACASEDGEAGCSGQGGFLCAAFCGSDVVAALVCVDGQWQCPAGYVHGNRDCPAGTCFGPPMQCCSPSGESSVPVCQAHEGGLVSVGECPSGAAMKLAGTQCSDAGAD